MVKRLLGVVILLAGLVTSLWGQDYCRARFDQCNADCAAFGEGYWCYDRCRTSYQACAGGGACYWFQGEFWCIDYQALRKLATPDNNRQEA